MVATSRELTDPLTELYRLLVLIRKTSVQKDVSCNAVITALLASTPPFGAAFKAYAIINKRFEECINLVNQQNDDDFEIELQNDCIAALHQMQNYFSEVSFNQQAHSIQASCLQEHHLTTIRHNAPRVRRIRPMLAVSSSDAADFAVMIADAMTDISSIKALPSWAADSLQDQLHDLMFVVSNINLFGQNPVLDELMKLQGTASGIVIHAKLGSVAVSLESIAKIILLGVGLFAAPYTVNQALPWWKDAYRVTLEAAAPLLIGPPKQIEGPKASAPEKL